MKKRLKTIEQIKKEFKHYISGENIYFPDDIIYIHKKMFRFFGKILEVEKLIYEDYKLKKSELKHPSDRWWTFKENWFDSTEFIKEEDFII